MKSSRWFLMAVVIVLGVVASAAASAAGAPKWSTIATEHFVFNFSDATEASARRLAAHAEAIHDRLTSELQVEPTRKTHVVITDFTDEINGMASVLPQPYIILYENSDSPGGPFGVGDSLLVTFYHEYTHILQLGHVTGLPEAIRRVTCLSLIVPNAALPSWSVEGLATYEESLFSPIGRLHNSTWRMFVRAEYLENRMAAWDRVWAGPYRWPYGNLYYLYGSYFTAYLAERFGPDAPARLYHETADDLPFVQFKGSFKKVFGGDFQSVLDDWYASIRGQLAAEVAAVREAGLAEGTMVARIGGRSGYGVFGPDGTLYFTRRDISSPPALMAWRPEWKRPKELRFFPGSRPAVSPDGSTVAFGLSGWLGDRYYNDLYTCSTRDKRIVRLSRGLRAANPSWSPDGTQLAFIRNDPPNYSLYRMDADGENVTPVLQCVGLQQAFTPAWSPQGDRIAFSYYTPGDGLRIHLIGPDGSGPARLNEDAPPGEEYDPAWSPDGRYLFYTADYTGVFNIYAHDFQTGQTRQVTNVLTGAYAPSVSPDGRTLAYTGYNAGGYDQYVMTLDPLRFRELCAAPSAVRAAGPVGADGHFNPAALPPDTQPARPYSPWPTLDPMLSGISGYFSPSGGSRAQVRYWGNDVLNTVEYDLSGLWTDGGPGYTADVRVNSLPVNLYFSSALDYLTDDAGSSAARYWNNGLGLGRDGRGLLSPFDEWAWKASAAHSAVWDLTGGPERSFLEGRLALHYGEMASYSGPVLISRGWTADYTYRVGCDAQSAAFDHAHTADLRLYAPLFRRVALQLHGGFDLATDGSACFDFAAPGWNGASGDFAWEAGLSVEAPLFHPERGFAVFPLYLHGFNLYTAAHAGQVAGDAVQAAAELGLVSRLQFFRVPLDLYVVGVRSLTAVEDAWGFRWWVRMMM